MLADETGFPRLSLSLSLSLSLNIIGRGTALNVLVKLAARGNSRLWQPDSLHGRLAASRSLRSRLPSVPSSAVSYVTFNGVIFLVHL